MTAMTTIIEQAIAGKDASRRMAETWAKRIAKQGPWNPSIDTDFSLDGAPSEPMPVTITNTSEFMPFFDHLASNGTDNVLDVNADVSAKEEAETYYDTHMLEFGRGVLYKDQRMDLCKQVLGPPSLPKLMDSLDTNTFVRHFLFGNNIIGPNAALRIAQFIQKHPDQIETWYLAGNCINPAAFSALVEGLKVSPAVTNVWLKRNPLGPESVDSLYKLITETPNLRTLDLDQTSLGDKGISQLFSKLSSLDTVSNKQIPLRHIYLNATGAGPSAAKSLAAYLSSPSCTLESLYLSCNPLGDVGATHLASALGTNTTLQRLVLQSTGLTDAGALALLTAATHHPTLQVLDLSHAFATADLRARYNWLTDMIAPAAVSLVTSNPRLRFLDLGYTQLSPAGINSIHAAIASDTSHRLVHFSAKPRDAESVSPPDRPSAKENIESTKLRKGVSRRLHENVYMLYGMGYDEWFAGEKRFVVSPRDVRFIDSVYRNRDAKAARRGLMRLKKNWDEGDETLDMVMGAGDEEGIDRL